MKYREWIHHIPEGARLEPLDRWVFSNGQVMIHSDVDELALYLFDSTSKRILLWSQTGIAPGNGITGPIYSTLQTGGEWEPGEPGYNGRHLILPADILPAVMVGGRSYRLEIRLSPTDATIGELLSVHNYPDVGQRWHTFP